MTHCSQKKNKQLKALSGVPENRFLIEKILVNETTGEFPG